MKALLWHNWDKVWQSDADGKISLEVTDALRATGGTIPGRFLLECGDETAGRFTVTWSGAPGVPRNLVATPGLLSIALSWDKPLVENNFTHFKVYKARSESGPWVEPPGNGVDGTFSHWTYQPDPSGYPDRYGLSDTEVTVGVTYYYKVSAVNAFGEGAKAGPVHATPYVPAADPVPPTTMYAQRLYDTAFTVRLTWNVSQQHVNEYYIVYVSTDGTSWSELVNPVAGGTCDVTLSNDYDDDLWYRVTCKQAVTPFTESAPSPTWKLVGLKAPTSLVATGEEGQVSLTWTAPSIISTPTSYYVVRGNRWFIVSGTSYVDTDVTNGVTYTYHITTYYDATSISDMVTSHNSDSATATPFSLPTAPVLTGIAGDGQISYTWTAAVVAPEPITGYEWEFIEHGDAWPASGTVTTDLSLFKTSLTNGTTYDCRVRGKSAVGDGAWSNVDSRAPVVGPTPPTITQQPTNIWFEVGTPRTLTVVATGAFAYMWVYNETSPTLSGATVYQTGTDNVCHLTGAIGGYFACVVYGPGRLTSVISNWVIALRYTLPVLYYDILDDTVDVEFSWDDPVLQPAITIADATRLLTYTVNGGALTYSIIPGTSKVITPFADGDSIAAWITVEVYTEGGFVFSTDLSSYTIAFDIDIAGAPTIDIQPSNVTCVERTTATFTVVAHGHGILHYQWKKNGVNVGTDSATLTIASVALGDAGSYNVTISDDGTETTTSNNATLTVNLAAPDQVTMTSSLSVVESRSATLSVTCRGSGTLTYTWLLNGAALPTALQPHGPAYTIPHCYKNDLIVNGVVTVPKGDGVYTCSISNFVSTGNGGTTMSPSCTVTVLNVFSYATALQWCDRDNVPYSPPYPMFPTNVTSLPTNNGLYVFEAPTYGPHAFTFSWTFATGTSARVMRVILDFDYSSLLSLSDVIFWGIVDGTNYIWLENWKSGARDHHREFVVNLPANKTLIFLHQHNIQSTNITTSWKATYIFTTA